tara:strand:- start:1385 stop:1603 length:219 start_codon:yes stop_codon:yes gene_type:complete
VTRSEDTIEAYEEFLSTYPVGPYPVGHLANEALVRLRELRFMRDEIHNTIEAYGAYLKNIPWAPEPMKPGLD